MVVNGLCRPNFYVCRDVKGLVGYWAEVKRITDCEVLHMFYSESHPLLAAPVQLI